MSVPSFSFSTCRFPFEWVTDQAYQFVAVASVLLHLLLHYIKGLLHSFASHKQIQNTFQAGFENYIFHFISFLEAEGSSIRLIRCLHLGISLFCNLVLGIFIFRKRSFKLEKWQRRQDIWVLWLKLRRPFWFLQGWRRSEKRIPRILMKISCGSSYRFVNNAFKLQSRWCKFCIGTFNFVNDPKLFPNSFSNSLSGSQRTTWHYYELLCVNN